MIRGLAGLALLLAGCSGAIGEQASETAPADCKGLPATEMVWVKGGRFIAGENPRYRPAARQYQERDLGTDHIGFRVVDNRRGPPR